MSGASCPSCGREWPPDPPGLQLAVAVGDPLWEGIKEFCCWGHLEMWAADKRAENERAAAVRAAETESTTEGATR